jgi:flagellar basal body-associated protein FliL
MTGWHRTSVACNDRPVMSRWLRIVLAVVVILGATAGTASGATASGSIQAPRGQPETLGAQPEPAPTTTAVAPPGGPTVDPEGTAASDPAQARLRWIIIGLLALAAVILAATIAFWFATRPPKVRVEVVQQPVIAPPPTHSGGEAGPAAPAGELGDDAIAAALASMMAVDRPLPRPGPPQQ